METVRERKFYIKAVHEKNLDSLLESLGLTEPLEQGKLVCAICGCKITRANIGTIFPDEGQVRVCCNNPGCLPKVIERKGN